MYLNKNDHIIFFDYNCYTESSFDKGNIFNNLCVLAKFHCIFIKRRWYNGQHSCLPSSWSGFDSRPTQDPFGNFFLIFLIVWYGAKHKKCYFKILKNVFLKKLSMPWPGFEPGLLRPQRRVLTTRRSRLRTDIVLWPWNVCILFNSTI